MSASYFSEDFAEASGKFLAALTLESHSAKRYVNPRGGPNGEEIAAHVARFGPRRAKRLLILISGHHGPETMVGSAIQSGWVDSGGPRDLPDDTAVLLVHGINCWGAAALRRNNEDNIDLCRNFIDFAEPLPENSGYRDIQATLDCPEIDGPQRQAAEAVWADYARVHGAHALTQAFMRGQYQHPEGFSYGGAEPAWSTRTLRSVVAEHADGAERICVVDLHSGVGPYGYGMVVTMDTGVRLVRTQQWFGGWLEPAAAKAREGKSQLHLPTGLPSFTYPVTAMDQDVTAVIMEFGTCPFDQLLECLKRDHWLWRYGDPRSPLGRAIKADLLEAHYPRSSDWRQAVWDRSRQVIHQALRGLSNAAA